MKLPTVADVEALDPAEAAVLLPHVADLRKALGQRATAPPPPPPPVEPEPDEELDVRAALQRYAPGLLRRVEEEAAA